MKHFGLCYSYWAMQAHNGHFICQNMWAWKAGRPQTFRSIHKLGLNGAQELITPLTLEALQLMKFILI